MPTTQYQLHLKGYVGGYDFDRDFVDYILVKEYEPFILSYIATMFFGVQFESIDKRRFKAIKLV